MSSKRSSKFAGDGARRVVAATVFLIALGAMPVSSQAQVGSGYNIDICRDVFQRPGVFLPKHPKADLYGCVHPRYLGYGQPYRPDRGHALRRSGTGAVARWESEWVRDDNKSHHITTFVHGLNRLPSAITIWFRPQGNSKSAYPVMWPWGSSSSGNPVTIEARGKRIRLHISANHPLHGVWSARHRKWRHFKRGFWKVVVLE